MAAFAKILLHLVKKAAINKLTKKDEYGNSPIIIAAGVVVGIIFLIAAFLQYIVENPIDALRAYFSDEDIVTVEDFQKKERGTDIAVYPILPQGVDENMLLSFGTDSVLADKLIREAYKHIGKPYVWAAFGPDRFDCSGYVAYCLRTSGVQQVLARPTCRTIWANDVVAVKKGEERPGDLIFFDGTQPTVAGATHIGIYLGCNKFIEANSSLGVTVSNSNSAWAIKHFYGFGRPKALVNAAKKENATKADNNKAGSVQKKGAGGERNKRDTVDKKSKKNKSSDRKKGKNKKGGNKKK